MGLTWEEFLKLASIITNLNVSIFYFDDKNIEIKERNRRVTAAAQKYQELFNNFKYMELMEEVRISLS